MMMTSGMLKLRLTVVLLLLWLTGLFNIERLHEPINLASFVYVLTALLATAIILTPKLRKATLVEITLVSLPVYAVIKWLLGYSFLGPHLPITVTEGAVLCVTNVLAWCVAHQIDEFMRSAAEMSAVQSCDKLLSLDEGEARMYGEVQRARRFNRSLSLATVAFTGEFNTEELDRLTHQARLEIARKYLETHVAKRLLESTFPGDFIVLHDGEFILIFPETTEDSVRIQLQKVTEELNSELGVRLRIGIAQFPDDECTLTGLIERAEAETRAMAWRLDAEKPAEPAPLAPKNSIPSKT